jgi:hypothetical protein
MRQIASWCNPPLNGVGNRVIAPQWLLHLLEVAALDRQDRQYERSLHGVTLGDGELILNVNV